MMNFLLRSAGVALGIGLAVSHVHGQSDYEPYRFSTLAGNLAPGSTDGSGTSARFASPAGVAIDTDGNVFVADSQNNSIRKITLSGVVTTFAGLAGVPGAADGNGTAARFRRPLGVATDSSGNVYVADTDNSTIRKISPSGNVTTIAGLAQTPGSNDASGSAARFSFPTGVAVDDVGVVYVSDYGNHTVRKIGLNAAVTTLAGSAGLSGSNDGVGGTARFNHPWGIARASNGAIFIADYENSIIRHVTSGGAVTTIAGAAGASGSSDGVGGAARFSFPTGVALDGAGNVFVADTLNNLVRKITPAGVVTTLAGSAGIAGSTNGTGNAVLFNYPAGVATDPVGHVYIADYSNNSIRRGVPASEPLPALRITSIERLSTSSKRLKGVGAPDQTISVQAAPSLNQPFVTIAVIQANGAGAFQYDDDAAIGSMRRFYRVE